MKTKRTKKSNPKAEKSKRPLKHPYKRGVVAAAAGILGLSRHHVWYVAIGERDSRRVSAALAQAQSDKTQD